MFPYELSKEIKVKLILTILNDPHTYRTT